MYDIFLKYFRDELSDENIIPIPFSRIKEFEVFMENNMVFTALSNEYRKYYREVLLNTLKDVRRLVVFRAVKKLLGGEIGGETFDKNILKLFDRITDLYTGVVSRIYVSDEDNILVKFLDSVNYMGSRYRKGDMALISLDDAFILYLKGYIKPVIKPYFRELMEIKD